MKRNVLDLKEKGEPVTDTTAQHWSFAKVPQLARREADKRAVLQHRFPLCQNFFQSLPMDLILMVRKYLTHADDSLYALMPLMLTCKTVYHRLFNEPNLVQSIAKDIFGFIHLCKGRLKTLHTFKDVLSFQHHRDGALLAHQECKTNQLLRNARLRSNFPFQYFMPVVVVDYTTSGRYYHLKCIGKRKDVRQMKQMLNDFEQVHNAIKLKIYKPYYNNCYPCSTEDNGIVAQVDSNQWHMHEQCLLFHEGQQLSVRFNIGLQLYNFYYRFVRVPEQCVPL